MSGQKYFTVLSLHINNIHAKKKGIAKKLILTLRTIMISQEVDLVAGDFKGTAWRCRSKDNFSTPGGIKQPVSNFFSDGAVLLQSGLNESWWADSMECYTYLRNVTDLLSDRKTPYERPFWETI